MVSYSSMNPKTLKAYLNTPFTNCIKKKNLKKRKRLQKASGICKHCFSQYHDSNVCPLTHDEKGACIALLILSRII